jgi:DNA polymerase III sliding clamp (beta) subunit (PCNA family)
MRLVEGEFPDYRQVVPRRAGCGPHWAGMSSGALRRTALLASERSHGVKLALRPARSLFRPATEAGEAVRDLEVSYQGSLSAWASTRAIDQVLNVHAAGDSIELGLTDEVGPAWYTDRRIRRIPTCSCPCV